MRRQKSEVRRLKNLLLITRRWLLFLCLLLTTYCLLFTPFAESTEKRGLVSDIERAILKELKSSISEDVEITGLRVIEGMDYLNSLEGYKVSDVVMNGYTGRNKMNFVVVLKDRTMARKNIVVEASYDVLVDVFVTSRPLIKGSVLNSDDFYVVKQKASKIPVGAVMNKDDIEGKILKTNIGQGVILRDYYLTTAMNIKRGQKVNVVVEGDNVVITTQGVIRNDAVVGGAARVLCDAYKKEISGVLVSPNTVRVKI